MAIFMDVERAKTLKAEKLKAETGNQSVYRREQRAQRVAGKN
jgi:hypothetical protein